MTIEQDNGTLGEQTKNVELLWWKKTIQGVQLQKNTKKINGVGGLKKRKIENGLWKFFVNDPL